MNQLPREITDQERASFAEDGIVVLRQLFEPQWIEKLRDLAEEDMAKPGKLAQELVQPGGTGRFFFDTFMWTYNEGFKDFALNSPCAEIAGQVMGSQKINLFFDQLLIKEPGTSEKTPWHHDIPYWPVRGSQVCTVWLALDPVNAESGAVEYIRGSHLWGEQYKPPAFAGDDRYKIDLPKVPDIEAERDKHEFLQFDLEPGDCTVHHGLLVHGAPGNSNTSLRRRAVVTRWAGDDAVYHPVDDIMPIMWEPTLDAGAPLDCDLWPVVWRRAA